VEPAKADAGEGELEGEEEDQPKMEREPGDMGFDPVSEGDFGHLER
jgi:hypothetical protein